MRTLHPCLPRRPDRTRETVDHRPARITVTVLAVFPKENGELRASLLQRPGDAPVFSLAHFVDGKRCGFNVFGGADLAKLADAVTAARAASEKP